MSRHFHTLVLLIEELYFQNLLELVAQNMLNLIRSPATYPNTVFIWAGLQRT